MSTSFVITFPDYVSGAPTALQLAALLATYGDIGGVTVEHHYPAPVETDTRADYRDYVDSLADDIAVSVKAGDCDDVTDAIHEQVDGSSWIIYTRLAPKVLEYSRNDGAMEDEGMCPESMPSGGLDTLITQAAYFAMCADVRDELERRGYDLNDTDSWFEDDDSDDSDDSDDDSDDSDAAPADPE